MRKRDHVIPLHLNQRELRHLQKQVDASGLCREEYLRSLIMGSELRVKPCPHHPELLRQISGLCNNANQLAHVANSTGYAGQGSIDEMLRITKEIWREAGERW